MPHKYKCWLYCYRRRFASWPLDYVRVQAVHIGLFVSDRTMLMIYIYKQRDYLNFNLQNRHLPLINYP